MSETGTRRLPARFAPLATGFFLTFIMTFVVSGVSTVLALGPTTEVLDRWPTAWATSWVIAFPTVLMVLPFVRRLVTRIVKVPLGHEEKVR